MMTSRGSLIAFLTISFIAIGCSFKKPVVISRSAADIKVISKGKALYETNCMKCHAQEARGTWRMPSLIQSTYGPKKFSDGSFFLAVLNGAKQRNWLNFGGMPPTPGMTRKKVKVILRYVRDLQQQAGIF